MSLLYKYISTLTICGYFFCISTMEQQENLINTPFSLKYNAAMAFWKNSKDLALPVNCPLPIELIDYLNKVKEFTFLIAGWDKESKAFATHFFDLNQSSLIENLNYDQFITLLVTLSRSEPQDFENITNGNPYKQILSGIYAYNKCEDFKILLAQLNGEEINDPAGYIKATYSLPCKTVILLLASKLYRYNDKNDKFLQRLYRYANLDNLPPVYHDLAEEKIGMRDAEILTDLYNLALFRNDYAIAKLIKNCGIEKRDLEIVHACL